MTQKTPKLITLSYIIQLITFLICATGWYKAIEFFDNQDYDNSRYWLNILGGTAIIGTAFGKALDICSYRNEPLLETQHPPEYPPLNTV